MIDEIGIEGIGLGFLHLPLLQLVFFLSLSQSRYTFVTSVFIMLVFRLEHPSFLPEQI